MIRGTGRIIKMEDIKLDKSTYNVGFCIRLLYNECYSWVLI